MTISRIGLSFIAALAASLLSACGGGGGSTSSTPTLTAPSSTISGVFDGTLTNGQPLTALLQNDGSYYLVYSNAASPQTALGAIVGSGSLSGLVFSSSNGLDLNLAGSSSTPPSVTLSATYTAQQSFNGTLTYTASNTSTSFNAVYDVAYATLPSLSALAGVYTGTIATKDLSENNLILTITSDGKLSGQLTCNCTIAATLAPRADGLAYIANLSMGSGTHVLSNKTFAGNAYLDAKLKRLYIVGNIVGSNEAAIFVGSKP
jgi:hypothetical protein